jgi:hypothetical protein
MDERTVEVSVLLPTLVALVDVGTALWSFVKEGEAAAVVMVAMVPPVLSPEELVFVGITGSS